MNVHPTKSEVRFLNEDEIVDAVVQAVQTALEGANLSRSFTVQVILFPSLHSQQYGLHICHRLCFLVPLHL